MQLFATSRLFALLFFIFVFQNFYAQTAEEEAQQMLDLVNGIRADRGIAPLVLNAKLNQAAYDHSNDMALNNYFSHTGLNGSNFSQRLVNAGYNGSPRGENIAAGNAGVIATFNQWFNSSGHLSNMLNVNSNEMGLGHALYNGSTYRHYWTQVFGRGSGVLSNSDVSLDKKIKIYPNPVKDILYISHQNITQQSFDIKVTSATGQIVYQRASGQNTQDLKIDLRHLSSGVYFLTFNNNTRKIVKY